MKPRLGIRLFGVRHVQKPNPEERPVLLSSPDTEGGNALLKT